MSQHSSLVFIHDFGQAVWQMALEPGKDLLALELRDMKEAAVSFSLLDLNTRTLVFDRYAFEEDWWMSLVAIKGNLLLVKQYHDSQQPEKQGFLAVNTASLEVEWWLENFQLLDMTENEISGRQHHGSDSVVKHFEITSGKEVPGGPPPAGPPLQVAVGAQYPTHYDSESSHFQTIKSFTANHFNMNAVGACDYLEVGDLIVISWYYSEGTTYTNVLSVMDSLGKIVIEEKLGTGLDAFASDTFFVVKNRLIFVANKTQLLVYELFGIA